MPVSPRLPKHLRNALGNDAGVELMTIIDEIRADAAKRYARMEERFDRMEARMDRMEERVEGRFDRVDERFSALEIRVSDVKSDLMKWSFVFWCGAVASVAALAGVLR